MRSLEELKARAVRAREHYLNLAAQDWPEEHPSRALLRIKLDDALGAMHLAETLYHNACFAPLDFPTKGTWRERKEVRPTPEGGKVTVYVPELIPHNKETEE